jgi:hypothetical protein
LRSDYFISFSRPFSHGFSQESEPKWQEELRASHPNKAGRKPKLAEDGTRLKRKKLNSTKGELQLEGKVA